MARRRNLNVYSSVLTSAKMLGMNSLQQRNAFFLSAIFRFNKNPSFLKITSFEKLKCFYKNNVA